jgi:hypothetical protein
VKFAINTWASLRMQSELRGGQTKSTAALLSRLLNGFSSLYQLISPTRTGFMAYGVGTEKKQGL